MVCQNPSAACGPTPGAPPNNLCQVDYPYRRIAASTDVAATRRSNCTRGGGPGQDQVLMFEARMDLISFDEFQTLVPGAATFGTYLNLPRGEHFCVDRGRRTVDGRRLAWLWMFVDGRPRGSSKLMPDPPTLIWSKQALVDAFAAANDPSLPMFTRHVETFPELAITFCLPRPA